MSDLTDAFRLNNAVVQLADKLDYFMPEIDNLDEIKKPIFMDVAEINKKQNKIYVYLKNLFNGNDKKYDELFKKKVLLLFNTFLKDASILSSSVKDNKNYLYTIHYKDNNVLKTFFDDDDVFKDADTEKKTSLLNKIRGKEKQVIENYFLNNIRSADLVIIEYSSTADKFNYVESGELQQIDIDISNTDSYIKNFKKHIAYNNYGKDTLKIANFDNSLFVKKYNLFQFFNSFNKDNGFEYSSINDAYDERKDEYLDSIRKYNTNLEIFLNNIDTFVNNYELKSLAGKSLFYILSKYWGLLVICLMVFILIIMYTIIIANFFISVYYNFVSLDKLNKYNSSYFGYETIIEIGGYYIDIPNLVFLCIYLIFFLLFIPINIWYISDIIATGNIRIAGYASVFNKNVDLGVYTLVAIYMFFIILNIGYYVYILSLSNSYKIIHTNHNNIQEAIYGNIDSELLK